MLAHGFFSPSISFGLIRFSLPSSLSLVRNQTAGSSFLFKPLLFIINFLIKYTPTAHHYKTPTSQVTLLSNKKVATVRYELRPPILLYTDLFAELLQNPTLKTCSYLLRHLVPERKVVMILYNNMLHY